MTNLSCPSCKSDEIKKNGLTSYSKQNYMCKNCGRQFVENGSEWFVSDQTKKIIDKLLLERLSFAGICRAMQVSKSWLLNYIKELYCQLSDHLYVEEELPDMEEYLDDRFDEEIKRIERLKKIQIHLKSIKK